TEAELRVILGWFLFTGDVAFKKIRVLPVGEKSRVALAKALTADANFVVLDEPTNHLDIQSVNSLIQALKQYEGPFIDVSHDRYLLENVANKNWYIEERKIKEYPGTYQEYEEWQAKRMVTGSSKTNDAKPAKPAAKQVAPKKVAPKEQETKKLHKE